MIEKKKYEKPELKKWGTINDLTKVGNTHPGGDTFGGSVHPPGHKQNQHPKGKW
jgi:hypothetical protein